MTVRTEELFSCPGRRYPPRPTPPARPLPQGNTLATNRPPVSRARASRIQCARLPGWLTKYTFCAIGACCGNVGGGRPPAVRVCPLCLCALVWQSPPPTRANNTKGGILYSCKRRQRARGRGWAYLVKNPSFGSSRRNTAVSPFFGFAPL